LIIVLPSYWTFVSQTNISLVERRKSTLHPKEETVFFSSILFCENKWSPGELSSSSETKNCFLVSLAALNELSLFQRRTSSSWDHFCSKGNSSCRNEH
jgi:hypothetical protein